MTEYHDRLKELRDQSTFRGQQWFGKRQDLVEQYAWAVPNEKVLNYISNCFDELVEVGAGDGYWAHELDKRGVRVNAFDPSTNATWYDVERLHAYEVKQYIKNRPVLMVWPPANDDLAARVVDWQPSHILYVGESSGGCTANDEFFDKLNRFYGPVENISIPSYEGVHDNFYHYVRSI